MKTVYIELAGQKHPLRMSLAATKALNERFGDMDQMGAALTGENVGVQIDALDDVLTILMKAGRIYASAFGEELPPPIPCKPSDLIDASDGTVLKSVLEAMRSDARREVEAVTKNGEATQGG